MASGMLQLPEKHQIIVSYICIVSGLLIAAIFLYLAYDTRNSFFSIAPLGTTTLVFALIAWFVRGGKIKGQANKEGVSVEADASQIDEDKELPPAPTK